MSETLVQAVDRWCETSRRALFAELEPLVYRLDRRGDTGADDTTHTDIEANAAPHATGPRVSALDTLQARFGLTALERQLVVLCAGFALDPGLVQRHGPATFALACALMGDSASHKDPVVLATLPGAHWDALSPERPLYRHRLVDAVGGGWLLTSPLEIDKRVLRYLLGIPGVDSRLRGVLEELAPAATLPPSHERGAAAIVAAWQGERLTWPVVELWGVDAAARRAMAALACQRLGVPLYRLRLHRLPRELDEAELVRLLSREARLEPVALLLEADGLEPGDSSIPARLRRLADDIEAPIVLASRDRFRRLERPGCAIEVPRPRISEQRTLFHEALTAAGLADRPGAARGVERVIAQFELSAPAIHEACAKLGCDAAGDERQMAPTADGADVGDALWDACRLVVRTQLDDLAQRSDARVGWSDLVVGESQRQALREIAIRVRQRTCVYDTWGFGDRGGRGLGIAALFSGPSGTGKTLAAEVIANELRLDLYRIDLSQVVSKYIGETERNLRRVFDAAEAGAAVLLFDEADALFGKRSEVRDSHDRYANIEVGYLLQRVEAYRGLAILTTNARTALDPAFQRRLAFCVDFPMPDQTMRSAIWHAVFPAQMPTCDLDFEVLARLHLSGGSIRSVALAAAFAAAEAGKAVGMEHVAAAAQSEYFKLQRGSPAELARYL